MRPLFLCQVLASSFLALFAPSGRGEDFSLQLREQRRAPGSNEFARSVRPATWPARETAVIVCDVWDLHHSRNAVRRLEEFAPRLDRFLQESRRRGATIIHSPSDCMPAYADHPARRRALAVPKVQPLPRDVEFWCSRIPAEEQAAYPIDQSDGGDDDEPQEHAVWAESLRKLGRNPGLPWQKQSDAITIDPAADFISDKGDEVWSILEQRGVKRVILTGVHTNMCVLGRPFGLRQMARHGKEVVLVRDLTDCMYNPRQWPFVDHFTGNDLIVSHVERFVCPTITSDQVLGGEPFRSRTDRRMERDLTQVAVPRPAAPKEFWTPVAVPLSREIATTWGAAPGWLRCAIRVPRSWAGTAPLSLVLAVPAKDGPQLWWNGRALATAATGTVTGLAAEELAFSLRPTDVLFDDANLLVIRFPGADGATQSAPRLVGGLQPLVLRGRWQLRLGDNDAWSNMPLPARFGAATDILFEPR